MPVTLRVFTRGTVSGDHPLYAGERKPDDDDQMSSSNTPFTRNGEQRYTVCVTPMARGGKWSVRLELAHATGAIVNEADLDDLLFATALEAEAAGWRLAEEWMQRTHALRQPLTLDERTLLVGCAHAVARCAECTLSHTFFELAGERSCARCHRDLIVALRMHLTECADAAIRRSNAAVRAAALTAKRNREVREATGVIRTESEVLRTAAQRARRRPPGKACPVCEQPIAPGQGVSFQDGELIHLACYETSRRRWRDSAV